MRQATSRTIPVPAAGARTLPIGHSHAARHGRCGRTFRRPFTLGRLHPVVDRGPPQSTSAMETIPHRPPADRSRSGCPARSRRGHVDAPHKISPINCYDETNKGRFDSVLRFMTQRCNALRSDRSSAPGNAIETPRRGMTPSRDARRARQSLESVNKTSRTIFKAASMRLSRRTTIASRRTSTGLSGRTCVLP